MQSPNISPGLPSKFRGRIPYSEQTVEIQPDKFITGVTRDSSGAVLGFCRVALFLTKGDVFMGEMISDVNGSYTFYATPGAYHYTVAYLTGSPDVFGTTVNTLGGEIAVPSAPASGPLVTDDFNRADGALGANWTQNTGFSPLTIVSNTCKGSVGSAHNVAVYTTGGTIAADQYAQFKVTTPGGFIGPTLRSNSADTFYTCYYNAGTATIYKWITGSATQIDLGGGSTITPAANDVVYLQVVGSALTMKVNGVTVCTATDSSITAAGYTGIDLYDNVAAVDDFAAGVP